VLPGFRRCHVLHMYNVQEPARSSQGEVCLYGFGALRPSGKGAKGAKEKLEARNRKFETISND
jgi:hypothetical protein